MRSFFLFLLITSSLCAGEIKMISYVSVRVSVKDYRENGLSIRRAGGGYLIRDIVTCEVLDGPHLGKFFVIQLRKDQRPEASKNVNSATVEVPNYVFSENNPEAMYITRSGLMDIIWASQRGQAE